MQGDHVIVTCEHGGNRVPAAFAPAFAGREALLASHRGWDPGALELGMQLADAVAVRFFQSTVTRLLVDLNRSIGHPRLHVAEIAALPVATRQQIVSQYYQPHRDAVLTAVGRIVAGGGRVIHIASHSFTPVLDGVIRQADVAWLYDPGRAGEQAFAARWRDSLKARRPDLRLRRNFPYQGKDDGLTRQLRRTYPAHRYIGIELEINQRFVLAGGAPWAALRAAVVDAFVAASVATSAAVLADPYAATFPTMPP
ncbi:MAG: N-formylglutamate amidohydrolase [Herminiimonas sp.]|nr:N-formylglutamate amidohydrolase [Herminiimonas sp.]